MLRRRGFTLIELLVVIAIIGILAAMLFPVFARARESARKTQCLANVKNIALGMQMYLTDYDRFPPDISASAEKDVKALVEPVWGSELCTKNVRRLDPYLRWPVILDDYIKNRDVWTCPSAVYAGGFSIVHDPGGAYGWAHWMADHPDGLIWPCDGYFPTGWGGEVTDSVTQGIEGSYLGVKYAGVQGMFSGSIGTTEEHNANLSTGEINDPAMFVVAGDSAAYTMWSPVLDVLQVCAWQTGGATPDTCSGTDVCGISADQFKSFWTDASFRKKYTRHLGGSNFGFADGHAKWMSAEAFLAAVPHQDCPCPDYGGSGKYHEGTIQGAGCYPNEQGIIGCFEPGPC